MFNITREEYLKILTQQSAVSPQLSSLTAFCVGTSVEFRHFALWCQSIEKNLDIPFCILLLIVSMYVVPNKYCVIIEPLFSPSL